MRFHARYPLLQLWRGDASAIVRAEHLGVARFEPVLDGAVNGAALLDLMFVRDQRIAVVPFIRIQTPALIRRERTPLVWPAGARELGFDVLGEIEAEVLPWLQSLTFARQQNDEAIRTFTPDARDVFERARADGFLGAAPYAQIMPQFAPYVYAARFCEQRTVGIEDAGAANGAAMLASLASSVCADLGTQERNGLATLWFGAAIFGAANGEYDIAIARSASRIRGREVGITLDCVRPQARVVEVASAIPSDVLVSFDPEDAPVASRFSVQSSSPVDLRPRAQVLPQPAVGGSSGTILLLVRDDFDRAPDADVDEARALAARLSAEGFTAELRAPSALPVDYRADLVHAFGLMDPAFAAVLKRFHESGIPVVANAYLGPAPEEALWGPNTVSSMHGYGSDEALLAEYFDLLALRKLRPESVPLADAVPALPFVDAAIVSGRGEQAQLRGVPAFRGEVVECVPSSAAAAEPDPDLASLVGTAPFALVHAPVEWRANLPRIVRAANALGITLIIAGPVVDPACLRAAVHLAPERVLHIPKPQPAELEALYRAARVFIDVAWAPRGLMRLSRAAAAGCRLLLSRSSFAPEIWPRAACAEPSSLDSIADGLERAWNGVETPKPDADGDLFSAAIFAYSEALRARQPA